MCFCDKVLSCLTRATDREKEAVRAELEAHMEDHRDALVKAGETLTAAMDRAEEAMGDPEVVGQALNAQFSTFWLWAKRVTQGIIGFLLLLALVMSQVGNTILTGPWDVLSGAWENWQARQGKGVEFEAEYAIHSWKGWETMQVGEEVICLVRVDLTPFYGEPGYYEGLFYFCTYNQDLFTSPNAEILGQLTITPESGIMIDPEYNWGWHYPNNGKGVSTRVYSGLMSEGENYVDVTYDHYGTYVTMRCYLDWEEGEP